MEGEDAEWRSEEEGLESESDENEGELKDEDEDDTEGGDNVEEG